MATLRTEAEFVEWLQSLGRKRSRRLTLGIGDDAALVRVDPRKELILTTDLSIEGVHFLPALHPARSVGHRALARALSDVAAMGGQPRFALVSLALADWTTERWVREFYAGVRSLASRTGVEVIGGDTARAPRQTFMDVVVVGEIGRGRALLRSGARPGDQIFVSGRLGLSALGLQLLKSDRQMMLSGKAVRAHLFPEPRIELGRLLSARCLASAAMDLSDGLSTDLARLCGASGVGANIYYSQLSGTNGARERLIPEATAMDLALNGGEDYELLFTVPPDKTRHIPARFRGLPIRRIGEVSRSKRLRMIQPDGSSRPLQPLGYDHFRK